MLYVVGRVPKTDIFAVYNVLMASDCYLYRPSTLLGVGDPDRAKFGAAQGLKLKIPLPRNFDPRPRE